MSATLPGVPRQIFLGCAWYIIQGEQPYHLPEPARGEQEQPVRADRRGRPPDGAGTAVCRGAGLLHQQPASAVQQGAPKIIFLLLNANVG